MTPLHNALNMKVLKLFALKEFVDHYLLAFS